MVIDLDDDIRNADWLKNKNKKVGAMKIKQLYRLVDSCAEDAKALTGKFVVLYPEAEGYSLDVNVNLNYLVDRFREAKLALLSAQNLLESLSSDLEVEKDLQKEGR